MRYFSKDWTPQNIAGWLKRRSETGMWDGRATLGGRVYLADCTCGHRPSGSLLILTREYGYHTSGWWKNPDYERCLHLSISFRDPETGSVRARDPDWSKTWLDAVFGATQTLLWCEPAASADGKRSDVWHYRVFYAPGWVAPILPRGEVYSRDWTPAGWLSFSDVQEQLRKEAEALQ